MVLAACSEVRTGPVAAASAQTHPTQIDTSDQGSIAAGIDAVEKTLACERAAVIVYYAFGQVTLRAERDAAGECTVQVVLLNELSESETPAVSRCAAAVLRSVNWFYEDEQVRQNPPGLPLTCVHER